MLGAKLCVCLLSDGRLVSSSHDATLRVWDLKRRREGEICVLKGHRAPVLDFRWGATPGVLCSAARDGVAILWDVEAGKQSRQLKGHKGHVTALCALRLVDEGRLDLDNFPAFGVFVGLVVAVSILIGTFGTASVIPKLSRVAETTRFSARRFVEGLRAALGSHSLRVLLGAAILSQTAAGVAEVLGVYMSTWFWGFDSDRMALLAGFTAIPVVLAVVAARRVSILVGDKRKTFIQLAIALIVWAPLAVIARLLDLAPTNDSDWIVPFVVAHTSVLMFVVVQLVILTSSMIMDVTDEVALLSGERHEGIVMSTLSFAGKCTSGLGNFVGLSTLQWIGFPSGEAAAIDSVPEQTILSLGLVAGPGLVVFYGAALVMVQRQRLTRARYEEIQAELASQRGR